MVGGVDSTESSSDGVTGVDGVTGADEVDGVEGVVRLSVDVSSAATMTGLTALFILH